MFTSLPEHNRRRQRYVGLLRRERTSGMTSAYSHHRHHVWSSVNCGNSAAALNISSNNGRLTLTAETETRWIISGGEWEYMAVAAIVVPVRRHACHDTNPAAIVCCLARPRASSGGEEANTTATYACMCGGEYSKDDGSDGGNGFLLASRF